MANKKPTFQLTETQAQIYEAYKTLGSMVKVSKLTKINEMHIRKHIHDLIEMGAARQEESKNVKYRMLNVKYEIVPDPPGTPGTVNLRLNIAPEEREWMLTKYRRPMYQKRREWAVEKLAELGFKRSRAEINYMAIALGAARKEGT